MLLSKVLNEMLWPQGMQQEWNGRVKCDAFFKLEKWLVSLASLEIVEQKVVHENMTWIEIVKADRFVTQNLDALKHQIFG